MTETIRRLKEFAADDPHAAYKAAGYAGDFKPVGGRLTGLCPFHDDHNPSLTVYADGCFHCFGCDAHGSVIDFFLRQVHGIAAPGRDDCTPQVVADLAARSGLRLRPTAPGARRPGGKRRGKREYAICSPDGTLVAEHVRTDDDTGKQMFWRRNGQLGLGGLKVAQLPLYAVERLPVGAPAVIVTEGEKACDALVERFECAAVGTVTGANSTPSPQSLEPLTACGQVYLWPDADEPGAGHMTAVAARLCELGARPRIIDWPDAPPKGDAADFDGDAAALQQLLADAVAYEPQRRASVQWLSGANSGHYRRPSACLRRKMRCSDAARIRVMPSCLHISTEIRFATIAAAAAG